MRAILINPDPRFRTTRLPNEVLVDLDIPPPLPPKPTDPAADVYDRISWNHKGGEVLLERRGDNLFVNNRRVILHLHQEQVGGEIGLAKAINEALEDRRLTALHPNILGALVAFPHLIPPSFLHDEAGRWRRVIFPGAGFENQDCGHGVQALDMQGGKPTSICIWVNNKLNQQYPIAVIEGGY